MSRATVCAAATVGLATLGSIPTLVGQEATGSPPPPEVARTVEAVVGRWSGRLTAVVGSASESFPWRMECAEVALGAGAACTMSGEASIGRLAQGCLLAYDPGGRAVHYMCVTSMGEVHDHEGRWTGPGTIEFAPFEGFITGDRVVETLTWTFPDPTTIVTRSAVTTADGASMTFEFRGARASPAAATRP